MPNKDSVKQLILSCLNDSVGVSKLTIISKVQSQGTVKQSTILNVLAMLRFNSEVTYEQKLYRLAPEGYVRKKNPRKPRQKAVRDYVDYRDFLEGGDYFPF